MQVRLHNCAEIDSNPKLDILMLMFVSDGNAVKLIIGATRISAG